MEIHHMLKHNFLSPYFKKLLAVLANCILNLFCGEHVLLIFFSNSLYFDNNHHNASRTQVRFKIIIIIFTVTIDKTVF